MASKLSLLSGIVKGELNEWLDNGSSSATSSNERHEASADPKARKEERKRAEAQREAEDCKRKARERAEYQREKMREGIRAKYGIEKRKDHMGLDAKTMAEVKADYELTEEEFSEFQQKVADEQAEKEMTEKKIERKLHKRQQKKELKQSVKESCKTQ